MSPDNLRIISVVPSQTELLYHLGLDNEVVGITKFCIHPEHWFRHKKRVGGTKNLNLDTIASLHPNLILANKEENEKAQIEFLQTRYPVYVSDIVTLEDAFRMIKEIGALTNRSSKASDIVLAINEQRHQLPVKTVKPRALYLIWYEPWMAAGRQTFIDSMLQEAGFENCLETTRYPVLDLQEIQELQPDLIFLSSEPFSFKEKHVELLRSLCPMATIKMVDGELFSWYGSRMSLSFAYFSTLHESLS